MTPDKLQKLQTILKEINEGITRQEFVDSFKQVIAVVKSIKDTNMSEWKLIHQAMQKIPDKMMSEMYDGMSKTEKKMVKDCMDMCEKMCAEMDKKHKAEMGKMDLEVRMIKADREAIIEDALAKVPAQVIETPESARDKLESIQEEEQKLSISAIAHLEEKLKKLESKPTGKGGGGFSYTAMDFHIVDDETPTGTINGSNKAFTIKNPPNPVTSLKVYLNGQRMRTTEDYTFSGNTITFVTAPPTTSILLVDYRI